MLTSFFTLVFGNFLWKYTTYAASQSSFKCLPIEEGVEGQLCITLFVLKNENSELFLEHSGHTVVHCSHFPVCQKVFPEYFINHLTSEGSLKLDVFSRGQNGLKNVSPEGEWGLISVNKKTSQKNWSHYCHVKTYVRSDEVICQAKVKKKGYQVDCTSEKMFPRGLCQFVVKNNEKLLDLSKNDIEYRYNEIFGRKVYYDTQCSLLIINSRISPGHYDVAIAMYPNVSGSNEDVKYGTNGSLTFYVAEPEVSLDACESIVEEGALVECTCVSFERVIVVKIMWMEGDKTISKIDNQTLRFIARRNSAVFYCLAIDQFGLQSKRLTYEPFILSKCDLMTCSLMMDDDILDISCTVLKVYPVATCIFNIQSNATNFSGNVTYNHVTRPGVPIYYDTVCRYTSSRTDLQPGQYTVQVTSFPTINSSKSINLYSTAQLLHFSIRAMKTNEPENPSIPETKTSYIILVIVFTTVVLMLLGCLSCLASCILRRTKSSKINPSDIRQNAETRLSTIATVNSDGNDYILDYENNVPDEPPLDLVASSSRSLQHPQPGIQHKVYIGPIDVNVSVDTAKPQTSATDCTVSQDSIDGIDLMGVSFNNGHSSDDEYISPIDDDSTARSVLSDGPIYDTTGGASTTDQMYDFAASVMSSEAIYEGLSHEDSLK